VPLNEAIRGVIETLGGHPVILALVVMNIALLVFIFYSENRSHSQHAEIAKETHQILAKCIPADELEKLLRTLGTR